MKKILSLYYQFQLPQQSIKKYEIFHVDNFLAKLSKSGMWTIEVDAVIDWLPSGKTYHIMRDNPMHNTRIMGGAFGMQLTEGTGTLEQR